MADKREQILERLKTILDGVPSFVGFSEHTVVRNRALLQNDVLPALVLLDGNEEEFTSSERRGRTAMGPQVMLMQPQIFCVLKPRTLPSNELVGEELNMFRAAIIQAINTDAPLLALLGANGQVVLRRVDTDLNTGNQLRGEAQFFFAIKYVLNPAALDASDLS
jgi:hypothetical protein